MNAYKITNLSDSALAENQYLANPEKAEWKEIRTASMEYDADSQHGLRVVCRNCGSTIRTPYAAEPSSTYATCPHCGNNLFSVYQFKSPCNSIEDLVEADGKMRLWIQLPGALLFGGGLFIWR